MRWPTYILASVLLASCASNPGIVAVSQDTFLLAKQDHTGMFGNAAAFKAGVIHEANAFAAARGKVAVPVSIRETPAGPGRWLTIDYQFRIVDSSDLDAKRADVLIESSQKSVVDLNLRRDIEQPDTYTELLKLDDLRKRGVLTEAEFEAQKKRLLSGRP